MSCDPFPPIVTFLMNHVRYMYNINYCFTSALPVEAGVVVVAVKLAIHGGVATELSNKVLVSTVLAWQMMLLIPTVLHGENLTVSCKHFMQMFILNLEHTCIYLH